MSESPVELGAMLFRWLGRALGGPVVMARSISAATASVAVSLLTLRKEGLVTDISRIKESLIRTSEAQTEAKIAEAKKKVAEAAEAANRANLPQRRDAIARAEKKLAQANVARTNAEADAIRMDAESHRIEAQAKLLEEISRLRQEGGDLIVDEMNLRSIINLRLPSTDETSND